jgi:peptidoglycan/LPS O-acetylase OafA/YrhL
LRRACAFGHEAVAVFIVLSGYCLMLPVVRSERDMVVDLRNFLRRRAWRILPPYYAALAASLLLLAAIPVLRAPSGTLWDDSLPGLDVSAILAHVLVVHNWLPSVAYQINGPLWSVASEWQIYFFFPLVLLPVWRRFGMLATLLVAALLGYAPLLLVPAPASTAIPWYLLLFGLGMAAAAIGFSPAPGAKSVRGLPWGWLCAALWLGCFVFSMGAAQIWFGNKPIADLLVGLLTMTLLLHLTERAQSDRRGPLLALLESKPLVGLGHFSYSLYLTHLPVLAICYFALRDMALGPGVRSLVLLTLGSILSLIVAYAFHRAIERRFMLQR